MRGEFVHRSFVGDKDWYFIFKSFFLNYVMQLLLFLQISINIFCSSVEVNFLIKFSCK